MNEKPYIREVSLRDRETIDFEKFPFTIPSIKNLDTIEFHEDVTFIIGENGTGKSTLLEGIAIHQGFSLEGGSKNVRLQTHNNASELHEHLGVTKGIKKPSDYYFLRAESFYNIATHMEELGFEASDGKTLHQRSHGESFMEILTNRMWGEGLYLMDEPEAALSPYRQMSLLTIIHELVKNKSQFIIATHSPILLAYPNAKILEFNNEGIKEVQYKETEHYQITKTFLDNPEYMIQKLLFSE